MNGRTRPQDGRTTPARSAGALRDERAPSNPVPRSVWTAWSLLPLLLAPQLPSALSLHRPACTARALAAATIHQTHADEHQRNEPPCWVQLQRKLGSADSDLSNLIADFLAAGFALTARALLHSAPDPETRWQRLRQLRPAAARLRAGDLRSHSIIQAENRLQDKAVARLALLRCFGGLGGSPPRQDHEA